MRNMRICHIRIGGDFDIQPILKSDLFYR